MKKVLVGALAWWVTACFWGGDLMCQSLAELAGQQKRSAQSQPATKTYTNDDLARYSDDSAETREVVKWTSGVNQPTSENPPTPAPTPAAGEGYWRKRTADLVAARNTARREVEELQSELNLWWTNFHAADDPARRADLRAQIDERAKLLEDTKNRLAQATKDLEALGDDARKAAALPGWVRHD